MSEPTEDEEPVGSGVMRMAIVTVIVAALVVAPLVWVAINDPVRTTQTPEELPPLPEGDLPFGLSSKASLSDFLVNPAESSPDQGVYALLSVPKPSSHFEGYAVTYFDGAGICFIRAIDEIGNSDALGIDTRSAMDRIAASLTQKYGKPASYMDVCGGGVVCEQRFWDYALKQGSRIYGYTWDKPKTQSPVRAISLEALGMSAGTYIRITYRLGNEKKCEAARLRADSSSL